MRSKQVQSMYEEHESMEEDPRMRSKCSTPKKNRYNNQSDKKRHREEKQMTRFEQSQQKTQQKNTNDFVESERVLAGFEKLMEGQVSSYEIIAGTLKEYVKEQKQKEVSHNKYVRTVVQIIKAYTRSQITEISPAVSQLIHKILDTLPQKSSTRHSKQKKKQKSLQISIPKKTRHRQQQIQPQKNQKSLKSEIEQLENTLFDLKQQSKILEQVKQQYDQMDQQDKIEYIKQLEEIVKKQRQILSNFH